MREHAPGSRFIRWLETKGKFITNFIPWYHPAHSAMLPQMRGTTVVLTSRSTNVTHTLDELKVHF